MATRTTPAASGRAKTEKGAHRWARRSKKHPQRHVSVRRDRVAMKTLYGGRGVLVEHAVFTTTRLCSGSAILAMLNMIPCGRSLACSNRRVIYISGTCIGHAQRYQRAAITSQVLCGGFLFFEPLGDDQHPVSARPFHRNSARSFHDRKCLASTPGAFHENILPRAGPIAR